MDSRFIDNNHINLASNLIKSTHYFNKTSPKQALCILFVTLGYWWLSGVSEEIQIKYTRSTDPTAFCLKVNNG